MALYKIGPTPRAPPELEPRNKVNKPCNFFLLKSLGFFHYAKFSSYFLHTRGIEVLKSLGFSALETWHAECTLLGA